MEYGPTNEASEWVHSLKYRGTNETFKEAMSRVASSLQDDDAHYQNFRDILLNMRFLPAGRIQAAMGSPRQTTPYNCFLSGEVSDNSEDIMLKAGEAFQTMRLGGGIGYDFSLLRPRGDLIRSLESRSSGPVSFMGIFDAVCATVRSAGHRRGAQMSVLRVDHPDIEEFVEAKQNSHRLTNFNVSVAVTDAFMKAVKEDTTFDLVFNGRAYKTVRAKHLWEKILRATWSWAEPGVLFIDRINRKNNLWYCETIASTNPCAEQPLPPYGACLLGSFNLTKYIVGKEFDYEQFGKDIPIVVRAMDNVVDRAIYPLPQQREEATNKRRMGLGITGVANAIERLGYPYGSPEFLNALKSILSFLRDQAYLASIELSIEKGPFPLFDVRLLESEFASTLPENIREDIARYGLRNSHLLSVAPTGTISLTADNVSSGIEPVFSLSYTRDIHAPEGQKRVLMTDFAFDRWGVRGRTADELSAFDHVNVLTTASYYVDSACSKTCNVGDDVTWEDFKEIYMRAYDGGASGCTTFRAAGERFGILNAVNQEEDAAEPEEEKGEFIEEGSACYFDSSTGLRACE